MTGNTWQIVQDGQKADGQFSLEQILELLEAKPESQIMVWKPGMEKWSDPKRLPEFSTLTASAADEAIEKPAPPASSPEANKKPPAPPLKPVAMDHTNHLGVKNKVKLVSVVIAVMIWGGLAAGTFGFALIWLVIAALIAANICKKEEAAHQSNLNVFKKMFPFHRFGQNFGDFQHVFHHEKNLAKDIVAAIARELKQKTPISELKPLTIKDVDKGLISHEERAFYKADAGTTLRGSTITVILEQTHYGSMQSIHWWVLVGGYIDRNKKFNFLAYAPLTIFFWIVKYLKREFDVLSMIRSIYTASYNDMDVLTQILCLQEAIFSAMVDELEKNGVDTSDIRAKRMQVMNISISGGKVSMGNVVQGAMNKVMSNLKGGK